MNELLNIVIFGPPGSGKGTQAEKLVQKYNLVHLSTGDMLRKEIADRTPLGMEAKNLMDKGLLVPDEVVVGIISSQLDQNPNSGGFIFDGFPRTIPQAEALDNLLKFKNTSITTVLMLDVPEEELVTRLKSRGKIQGRDDDNELVIRQRIVEYENKTEPVADYYRKQRKLVKINGLGSMGEVNFLLSNQIDIVVSERKA